MKQLLILAGAVLVMGQAGWGATICAPGSIATYLALGSSGCTIGTQTFSNFQTLSAITGALPIGPGSIFVTPSGGNTSPVLAFNTSATTSAMLEAIFTYRVSGNSITGSMITLSGSSFSGNGVVTHIQNLCGGGTFGVDGVSNCSGSTRARWWQFLPGVIKPAFPVLVS